MINNDKAIAKDHSTAFNDNHGNIYISQMPMGPRRSILFSVCKIIADADIEYGEYSIEVNANWDEKLNFNNVSTYRDIFDNYASSYDEVEEILKDIPKREKMIRKIFNFYKKVEKGQDVSCYDGDTVLSMVFDEIKELVNQINNTLDLEKSLIDEDIDEAIYCIMFYVFTKCKLLRIPPKENKRT